jgi:hypothetical protein
MLEIVALFYLTAKIGMLAERKGLKKGTWKLYTVLAWIGAEFFFALAVLLLMPGNLMLALLIAYGAAIGSYFALRANLNKRPDADIYHDIDQIGTEEHHPN